MSSSVYDFAIIGAGAAGGQLALAMASEKWFENKRILIIDKDEKSINDKTWCYWEKGTGKWDKIVTKKWHHGIVSTDDLREDFALAPYTYKMVRSIDFYSHLKQVINDSPNFDWVVGQASTVLLDGALAISVNDERYLANHVFDSRIHPNFFQEESNHIRVLQHFKGWEIRSDQPVFDPDQFVMMDFRKPYKGLTAFTYLLPFSETEALIEYTFFTSKLEEENVYDNYMRAYLKDHYDLDNYEIISSEKGVIPMSNYPFHDENNALVTKIGTGGSWVRASTGYSFRKTSEYVDQVINNVVKGEIPSEKLIKAKFQLYDTLFLDILDRKNQLGPSIFGRLYKKNPPKRILRFLDGHTSFIEDLKLMWSVDKWLFIKSLLYQYLRIKLD